MLENTLRINEIYKSIQGESTHTGRLCTFIRLTGCNLRCTYCDTAYAFHEGQNMSIDAIFTEVKRLNVPLIELTGGEPLIQRDTPLLAGLLINSGYEVLIETGGSLDIGVLPPQVKKIMDIKGPRSKESHRFFLPNLSKLSRQDEIKFIVHDREEYEWSKNFILSEKLLSRCTVLLSPVVAISHPVETRESDRPHSLNPKDLAEWIIQDNLPVRMQYQMHKIIWDPDKRGV